MARIAFALPASLIALAWAAGAEGHHAFLSEYDTSYRLDLKGVITTAQLVNPHSAIHIVAAGAGGPPRAWIIEAPGPATLARIGLSRDNLRDGAEVAVSGYGPRDRNCPADPRTQRPVCRIDARYLTVAGKRYFLFGTGGPPAANPA